MASKRKSLIFFTVLVALSTLLIANQVSAFSDEPCYGLNYDCPDCSDCVPPPEPPTVFFGASSYGIRLVSITEAGDGFNWLYEALNIDDYGKKKGLNVASFLIPYCCTVPPINIDADSSVPSNGVYAPPGVGSGGKTDFGEHILQARVFSVTPDSSFPFFTIRTNTSEKTFSTILLTVSGTNYPIKAVVPGCTPPPDPGGEVGGVLPARPTCLDNWGDSERADDNVHYVFTRKANSQSCIDPEKPFYICPGSCPANGGFGPPDETECLQVQAESAGDHVLASSLMAQRCEDEATNTSTFPDNPHYLYETYSGGYKYVCCYDLNDRRCEDLSFCR